MREKLPKSKVNGHKKKREGGGEKKTKKTKTNKTLPCNASKSVELVNSP